MCRGQWWAIVHFHEYFRPGVNEWYGLFPVREHFAYVCVTGVGNLRHWAWTGRNPEIGSWLTDPQRRGSRGAQTGCAVPEAS